jgi:UDP-glucose 4-epimerase
MKNNKIFVTGGAGYIGSHVVRQLGAAGESVITLDHLSTGFAAAVTSGALVVDDLGDAATVIHSDLSRLRSAYARCSVGRPDSMTWTRS